MDDAPHSDDIYDTSIYLDYADLTDERRQELYREFLDSSSEDKRLSKYFFIIPLVFAAILVVLFLTAIINSIVSGIGIFTVVSMVLIAAVLLCFIFVNSYIEKVKFAHKLRYQKWLKEEKRIIMVFKEKKSK